MNKARAVSLLSKRGRRYYGDFRGFRKVGGRYEALRPPGERCGTMDRDVAMKLLTDRVAQLEMRRRDKYLLGRTKTATLADYTIHHLRVKARSGRVRYETIGNNHRELGLFMKFVGADREIE